MNLADAFDSFRTTEDMGDVQDMMECRAPQFGMDDFSDMLETPEVDPYYDMC